MDIKYHNRINDLAQKDYEELLAAVDSSSFGLSHNQIEKQRQLYGTNDLVQSKVNIFGCIKRAFINPFSLILFSVAIISLLAHLLMNESYGQGLSSVFIIFVMLICGDAIRLIQEIRAKKITDGLNKIIQTTVKVLRENKWYDISSEDLVVGDIVMLKAGEKVPADLYLKQCNDLFVSQSIITGESRINEKVAKPLKSSMNEFEDYTNILFKGSVITGGECEGVVIAVGSQTLYGGISVKQTEKSYSFHKGSSSIARVLLKFIAILIPCVFIISGLTSGNWITAFLFSLSVAVGLVPELLPMVVNACLARGSYMMSRKQTIVKDINAMQALGNMDVLCVDKTGTITSDTLYLEYYMDILGNENKKVLDLAYLNSFYHSGVKNHIDTEILRINTNANDNLHYKELVNKNPLLDENPFDYSNRYASVLIKGESENIQIIKGSVEAITGVCKFVEYRDNIIQVNEESGQNPYIISDELTEDGMKVIAIAYKKTESSIIEDNSNDFILLGYLAFFDSPKKSAQEAICKLQTLKVDVRVLTGDAKKTTVSICSRLGIDTSNILTGKELDNIPEEEFNVLIEKTRIFAELTPKQKANIVETLKQNGHCVGYLGDGMNDLSAELQADVGISVDNAVEVVKESSDVILLKKDLNILEKGILEGRRAFINMTKYIKITSSSNFGNILAVVVASIFLPFFPMTSLQLLFLNLLYDTLCLVLPWDNVDNEELSRPIHWTGKNLSNFMTRFGPLSSLFDILTFAFLFFILCPMVCGGNFSTLNTDERQIFISIFQTGWFLESMWTQVLILHLLRTNKIPFVQSKPSKIVFCVTNAGIILFTLLVITPLGTALGLCKMPYIYYVFLVLVVISYLLLVSIMKSFYHRKYKEMF
ncbi:magnesium-translocating P-type ATPase [Frisingicoccus sp.]